MIKMYTLFLQLNQIKAIQEDKLADADKFYSNLSKVYKRNL